MKLLLLLSLFSFTASALEIGKPAPNFTLEGTAAKRGEVSLSDYKGKIVVLEWLNHGCPFVRKHYDSGNMQSLQKTYTGKNIIWLSIISSAPGKQGHVDKEGAIKQVVENKSSATNVLLDPTGKVGRLYGAKTTPHMYIVDKDGTLVYQGAIDDKADTDKASIPSSKNYVALALENLLNDQRVLIGKTKAYGCQVKY